MGSKFKNSEFGTGKRICELGLSKIGQEYVLGALAPKDDPNWSGPWDCAEFASWCVYQAAGEVYGCNNHTNPTIADAYTGFWARDAQKRGRSISISKAIHIHGAALLRVPSTGRRGHIAISLGNGTTIEAHSRKNGVNIFKAEGRRWSMGVLVPEVRYSMEEVTEESKLSYGKSELLIFRLTVPYMRHEGIKIIQEALNEQGYSVGKADGIYGPKTYSAVIDFQTYNGLLVDGEVGPQTGKELGFKDFELL